MIAPKKHFKYPAAGYFFLDSDQSYPLHAEKAEINASKKQDAI